MRINTKHVSVTLPETIYDELEKLAAKKGHRVSSYIRWLIWRHLDELDIQVSLFPQEKK